MLKACFGQLYIPVNCQLTDSVAITWIQLFARIDAATCTDNTVQDFDGPRSELNCALVLLVIYGFEIGEGDINSLRKGIN